MTACHQRILRLRAGTDPEAGSATIELVLLIPVLLLMLWFLLYCGRLVDTRLRIEDAAHQAARAASLATDATRASARARTTGEQALNDTGVTCERLSVDTAGNVKPGGSVTVTVGCSVGLRDLALLQVPGSTTLTAGFSAPVDVHRSSSDAGSTTP